MEDGMKTVVDMMSEEELKATRHDLVTNSRRDDLTEKQQASNDELLQLVLDRLAKLHPIS